MNQPKPLTLAERLRAIRSRIATAFTPTEPKLPRSVLKLEMMEDRTVPSTFSGTAYYATNTNGSRDTNEGVAAGVGVTVTPTGGSPVSTTTNSDGAYAFTGLSAGSYAVSFSATSGFTVTSPSGGTT